MTMLLSSGREKTGSDKGPFSLYEIIHSLVCVGAHTYQTQDEFAAQGEKAPFHHHDWTGSGAFAKSGSYNA